MVWDRRRALPPHAEDFRHELAAHVRENFPISRPSQPTRRSR
jgi:hypothetical protein